MLRGDGNFEGGDLWIGDLENPNYATRLSMDGNISHPNGNLYLASGYAYKNTGSTSTFSINTPTVVSPKEKPFGIRSNYSGVPVAISGALYGNKGVGLVFGGRYDGSVIQYMTATNVKFTVNNNLANYHGDIRVVSNKPLISPTLGNVTFVLPPADSDATLEVEGGVEFQVSSAGEVKLSAFTVHAGSRIVIPYNTSSKTTGVVRVTETFAIPEDEGVVQIRFTTLPPAQTVDAPRVFPLVVVPSTQTLDAERFAVVVDDGTTVDWRPVLRVTEDAESGTKSLVAVFLGKGKLVTADSGTYTGASTDFSQYTSALSDEKAASWSDGNMPHELAIYEFGTRSGYGGCIRTPYNRADDYVFPGTLLRTVGTSATFVLADDKKTTVNLDLTSPLNLYVVRRMSPTLDGTVQMGADVNYSAWNASVVTIASTLSGNGNWKVAGISGTSSPHSTIAFTADNSEWKGSLSLWQNAANASDGNSYHQKLALVNPAGLGGALDTFNYKALSLSNFSEVIVTNSLALADDLNRGIYVTNTAIFNVAADCDFICGWPITFDGPLRKTGGGTLSLGGGARFLDAEGALTDAPSGAVDCMLSVFAGSVKVLAHDAVNGVTVNCAANTVLLLPFNPSDANLKRDGIRNVATDVPFTAGRTIRLRLTDVDASVVEAARLTDDGYKQGLFTVKTSAAQNLKSNLVFERVAGLHIVREDDAETGTTTFSAYGKKSGLAIMIK